MKDPHFFGFCEFKLEKHWYKYWTANQAERSKQHTRDFHKLKVRLKASLSVKKKKRKKGHGLEQDLRGYCWDCIMFRKHKTPN